MMNILVISDHLCESVAGFELEHVQIRKWNEQLPSFYTYHAIVVDMSFMDKSRLLEVKDNINLLEQNLKSENINQDNLIVIVVCGSHKVDYEDKLAYDETDQSNSETIKKYNYDFLKGVIPNYSHRVEFLCHEEHYYESLSIKYISVIQYLDFANKYHLIFRYDPDSPECANIYPLVKAKKTSNACVAFEHRLGKGILVLLPGYDREAAGDICSALIKICRNYFKVREEYDELKLDVDVPKPIRDNYIEALLCFLNDLYNASCVLSGRALEATLKMIGAEGRSTYNMLNFLSGKGLLHKKTELLAAKIRESRNLGAHFSESATSGGDEGLLASETNAKNMLLFLKQFLHDIHPIEKTKESIEAIKRGVSDG